jgi:DNA polymerase-3 subunit delta
MIIDSLQEFFDNSSELPNSLLLFGEEEFLKEEAYHIVLQHLEDSCNPKPDIDIVDAEQVKEHAIIDIACSFPFISDKRIVIVKNADKLFSSKSSKSDKKSALLSYVKNPQPSTYLVLLGNFQALWGISSIKKNSRQQDKAKKILSSIKFPLDQLIDAIPCHESKKVTEKELSTWISNRLKQDNKDIQPEAAEYIIANAGQSLRDIANEIDKLTLYEPNIDTYTIQEVLGVVGSSKVYNVFELQKSIGKGDSAKAIEIIHFMMKDDKQEMLIITMITRYIVSLFKLSDSIKTTHNPYELSKLTGISSYFIPEYQSALRIFTYSRLENALFLLRNADLTLKSSSKPAVSVLQSLLISILA